MGKKYFVFLYTPGQNWLEDRPVTEQPLAEHYDYMQRLFKERILIAGGPFKDDAGAMGILEADSLDEATAIIQRDPAVINQVVQAVVHPWHPFVQGYVDKKPW